MVESAVPLPTRSTWLRDEVEEAAKWPDGHLRVRSAVHENNQQALDNRLVYHEVCRCSVLLCASRCDCVARPCHPCHLNRPQPSAQIFGKNRARKHTIQSLFDFVPNWEYLLQQEESLQKVQAEHPDLSTDEYYATVIEALRMYQAGTKPPDDSSEDDAPPPGSASGVWKSPGGTCNTPPQKAAAAQKAQLADDELDGMQVSPAADDADGAADGAAPATPPSRAKRMLLVEEEEVEEEESE